jgi:hypothetical protein
MPSDLPLMSTGRAMYPVPPQRGQSFGSTDPPQLLISFSPIRAPSVTKSILLRNTNTSGSAPPNRSPEFQKGFVATEDLTRNKARDAQKYLIEAVRARTSDVVKCSSARRRGGRVAECGGLLNRCTG